MSEVSRAERRLAEFLAAYRELCEKYGVMVGMVAREEEAYPHRTYHAYTLLGFEDRASYRHLEQAILEMQLSDLVWITWSSGDE